MEGERLLGESGGTFAHVFAHARHARREGQRFGRALDRREGSARRREGNVLDRHQVLTHVLLLVLSHVRQKGHWYARVQPLQRGLGRTLRRRRGNRGRRRRHVGVATMAASGRQQQQQTDERQKSVHCVSLSALETTAAV